MCTALEKWEKQNIERGIEQGIEQGITKSVLTLLKNGKSVAETAALLDLTEERVRKIQEENQAHVN